MGIYTHKDIRNETGMKKYLVDYATEILFPNRPAIGTGKSFCYSKQDLFHFKMFYRLNRSKAINNREIARILSKYDVDENDLLEKRITSMERSLTKLKR